MTEKIHSTDEPYVAVVPDSKPNLVHLLRELAAFQHTDVSIAKDAVDTIEGLADQILHILYAEKEGGVERAIGEARSFLMKSGLMHRNKQEKEYEHREDVEKGGILCRTIVTAFCVPVLLRSKLAGVHRPNPAARLLPRERSWGKVWRISR